MLVMVMLVVMLVPMATRCQEKGPVGLCLLSAIGCLVHSTTPSVVLYAAKEAVDALFLLTADEVQESGSGVAAVERGVGAGLAQLTAASINAHR